MKKIDDGLTNQQRYYRRHPERRADGAARVAKWRATHPAAAKAAVRAYYRANAEREREKARERCKNNRAAASGTPQQRLKERLAKQRRRALLAGCAVALTAAEWQAILAAHGHRCAYCGASGPLEQDHVVPLAKGGAHSATNIVPACKPCNSSKRDRLGPPPRVTHKYPEGT